MLSKLDHEIRYITFRPIPATQPGQPSWRASLALTVDSVISAIGATQEEALRELANLLTSQLDRHR